MKTKETTEKNQCNGGILLDKNPDDGVVVKMKHDGGEVVVQVVVGKNNLDAYVKVASSLLGNCATAFLNFTEANPDIKEMHFLTKANKWEEE